MKAVGMVKETAGVHLFGIRHLSPAGAIHLRHYLNEIKPKLVLVEGPEDATPLIGHLTRSGVIPPVAILAYTLSIRPLPTRIESQLLPSPSK
ncbi:DUF5682 family protein [Paenibacillus sp. MCAF20]